MTDSRPSSPLADAMHSRLERTCQRHPGFPRDKAVLVRLVKLLHRLFNERANELLRDHGLNHAEYNVLIMLDGSPEGMTAGELAEATSEKPPNITRLVDQLVAKGLVLRQSCTEDRRRQRVLLGPGGELLIDRLMPVIAGQLEQLFAGMPSSTLAQLEGLLLRLAERVETNR